MMKICIQTIWNDILSLFFPNVCHLCGAPLVKGEEQLCMHCLCCLHYIDEEDPRLAASLFIGKSEIREAGSFFRYEKGGLVQELIHELKYYDNKELAYWLGRWAFIHLRDQKSSLCDTDVLLPIPLHKSRLRERGYNQSEWIAKGISSVLSIPINTTSVVRRVKTQTQTRRAVYERWGNMESVFELHDASGLENKRVLLVDDVLTTGATLNSCASVLGEVSGIYLSAFTLAKV